MFLNPFLCSRCQLLLLNVTALARLEEMNPETESDGLNGDVGNASPLIYTALWSTDVFQTRRLCLFCPTEAQRPQTQRGMELKLQPEMFQFMQRKNNQIWKINVFILSKLFKKTVKNK